ncbi:MAG: hypothetical protein S4CHLAM6_14210 [Chlamydiae bacterium]|nr:hypothetical protein [Chlamydiota bacterium]
MIYLQKLTMIFEVLKRKKSLIIKMVALIFGLWIVFLASVPLILSKGLLVKQVNKRINGKINIRKVKLSWLKPQKFEGITLKDTEGQTVLTIKSLKTSVSLFDLLLQKKDFKKTSIDGLIGNVVVSKGKPSNLVSSLNTTSLLRTEKNKNRIHPVFILNKPVSGDFHVDNSSFLIQSQEHDPIYFNDIQLNCSLFEEQKSIIAHLACETSQNDLSGSVNLKLEVGGFDEKGQLIFTPLDREIFFLSPGGYVNLTTQVTNLPSEGIDHLLRLYNPNLSQIFSNAAGGPLTLGANLEVLKEKSKIHLSANANTLNIQFSGALQQNQFFLTEPSTCSLHISPALVANISKAISKDIQLSIDAPTQAHIQIERLTTPLDLSNFNFNNLSCNAQVSLNPMKFIGDKRFSSVEIKQIKGTVDTFGLKENLTLHLNALAYENKKPIEFRLDGELTKLINDQMDLKGIDQIKAHLIAQAKDIPTRFALGIFKNKSLASELLGPTITLESNIKGSLKKADLALALSSSRLNIPNIALNLSNNNQFSLAFPSTVELRATPKLAKSAISSDLSILRPFLLNGTLKDFEFSFLDKSLNIKNLDLDLNYGSFDFILSDYKPCHMNDGTANFRSTDADDVLLTLASHIELPSDFPFYQLDKKVSSKFTLDNFFNYLKGQPSLMQTKLQASNWSASLNGFIDKQWNYELLEEATFTLSNTLFHCKNQSVIESPYITALINPCSINFSKLNLSSLNINGRASIEKLKLTNNSFEHAFENIKMPFEYSGAENQLKVSVLSDPVFQEATLACSSFIQSGSLDFSNAKYHLTANLKRLPPNVLKTITSYPYDYESVLGPSLDISLSSNFQSNDTLNGLIDYELSSSILHSKGCFSFGDKIQSSENPVVLDYFMSPAGYLAISSAFKKDFDSSLFLEEPLHLKAQINRINKTISKNSKDFQLSFDGNFSIDKFVTNKGSLFDLCGSLNTSDIAHNLKLDLSANTLINEQEKGTAYFSAEFTDPLNPADKTINTQINGHINCCLKHFPTPILHDFISFNSPQLATLPELLGPSFDMNCTGNLKAGSGPLEFKVTSKNLSSQFALNFQKDHLNLSEDLKVKLYLSNEHAKLWLQKINPLFLSAELSNTLIKITLPKENFHLPISPFNLALLNIDSAVIDIEKLKLRPNDNLGKLLKLLKEPSTNLVEAWMTPLCFSINKGIITSKRIDFLINNSHHVAFWGDFSLNQNKAKFYFALPSQTLKQTFGFNKLPSNFIFQIPLYGDLNNLQADWATATAQLCLLGMSSTTSGNAGLDQILDVFSKSQTLERVPVNQFPLPWNSTITATSKKHTSTQVSDKEQSQILHNFFKDLRSTLNK